MSGGDVRTHEAKGSSERTMKKFFKARKLLVLWGTATVPFH